MCCVDVSTATQALNKSVPQSLRPSFLTHSMEKSLPGKILFYETRRPSTEHLIFRDAVCACGRVPPSPSHLGPSEKRKTPHGPQYRIPVFEGTHHKAYSTAQGWEFDHIVLQSLPIYFLVGRLGARDVTLLNLSFFI